MRGKTRSHAVPLGSLQKGTTSTVTCKGVDRYRYNFEASKRAEIYASQASSPPTATLEIRYRHVRSTCSDLEGKRCDFGATPKGEFVFLEHLRVYN